MFSSTTSCACCTKLRQRRAAREAAVSQDFTPDLTISNDADIGSAARSLALYLEALAQPCQTPAA